MNHDEPATDTPDSDALTKLGIKVVTDADTEEGATVHFVSHEVVEATKAMLNREKS